jgi:predicted lipoprotein with Yx(FWY)xxD motif
MRAILIITAVLTLLVLVPGTNAGTSSVSVAVHPSSYGRILFDGRGFVLYSFSHDPRGRSTCSGACASAWPPYLVTHAPSAGSGANVELLGAVRRAGGTLQATYAGRPLYYYVGDRKPGQILCQGVKAYGGLWQILGPTGIPVG